MGFFVDYTTEPWALLVNDWLVRQYMVIYMVPGKLGCNRQTDKWFGCVHKCSTRSVDILPTELCSAKYSVDLMQTAVIAVNWKTRWHHHMHFPYCLRNLLYFINLN